MIYRAYYLSIERVELTHSSKNDLIMKKLTILLFSILISFNSYAEVPNIIGGKYKKTKLEIPSKLVRPTSAFKREAIFSILESFSIKQSSSQD